MITWYKWMPVIYTDRLLKSWAAGANYGPISIIRPKYADDIGLHEHEYTHFKQFFRGLLVLHALGYWLHKDYRMRCEAEAYAAQLARTDNTTGRLNRYARAMSLRYGLSRSIDQCRNAIMRSL